MKIVMLILLTAVVAAIAVAGVIVRWVRANRKHDPIEYYRTWGGYRIPIVPQRKITKQEADAQAAAGYASYVCHFDSDGRLTRCAARYPSTSHTRTAPTERSRPRRKRAAAK